MQILLIVIGVIGGIIAIVLIAAAFGADKFTIKQKVTINKPAPVVYNYLKIAQNGEQFNKWVMTDPNMRKELRGIDGTVGFVYAWDSDNKQAGKGEQEITALVENKRIDYEVRFEKPFVATSHIHFEIDAVGDTQTNVTWVFNGTKNYMMKVIHILLNLQKALSNDMATSLAQLKSILEKQ